MNFAMMQHHKYSLTELENMMPWEREIYCGLLQKHIKEENERIEKEQAQSRRRQGERTMAEITKTVDPKIAAKDTNGDGHISLEEYEMDMEFKRKELEAADAMRDAQRKMAWFSLAGMLLYPFAVVLAIGLGLDQAAKILGDMASVYFVSVAAIVAAFYGSQALQKKQINGNFRGSSKTVTDEQQE